MIQGELTPEKYRFQEVFDASEKNQLPKEKPAEGSLATQFPAHFEIEPFPSKIGEKDPRPTPGDYRRHALYACLLKLSTIEIDGKEHVEEYLRYQYRRYFKGSTIRNSYASLECFLKLITGKGDIKNIERRDLEKFVEHEQDRGIKASTVRTRMKSLRPFILFLIEQGIVQAEVLFKRIFIKVPEPLPRAMDPDDERKLLSVIDHVRDRAMILVLLRTGMRIGELLNTRVWEINLKERMIEIYEAEKTRVGRVVYLSDDACEALRAWFRVRDAHKSSLIYAQGRKIMTYSSARNRFVKYIDKAGLTHKGYSLHCLRHTCATELLNAGMPLECVQQLLGHSSIEMTRRYAKLTDRTREKEYFKAMAAIERGETDGYHELDRELQTILEEKELLGPHDQELHE